METKTAKKSNLRKAIKSRLKAMEPDQKAALDCRVCKQLFSLPEFCQADRVYAYMALTWETGTREILEVLFEKGVPVALPKVLGNDMEFYRVHSFENLREGAFHILEPDASCEMVHWPDACMLVPGLGFTKEGKRLGKGGGYYDKLLSREPGHKTIALAYEFQMMEQIPSEEHDQTVDMIVTEERIFSVL